MKTKKLSLILGALLAVFGFMQLPLLADETAGERIQNKKDDAVRHTKKNYRKAKKEVRDATGNHSTSEDLKDAARNTGDAVGDAGKKVKRKVD